MRVSAILSALVLLVSAKASASDFSFTVTPTQNLTVAYALASYGDLGAGFRWSVVGQYSAVTAGSAATFTAKLSDAHVSDGRFAFVAAYVIPLPSPGGNPLTGVTLAMPNASKGIGKPFSNVVPTVNEDTQYGYLVNGLTTNIPYCMNELDRRAVGMGPAFPDVLSFKAGGASLVNFSTGTAGGTLSVRPVPEPGAFAALGMGALAVLRRRRLFKSL